MVNIHTEVATLVIMNQNTVLLDCTKSKNKLHKKKTTKKHKLQIFCVAVKEAMISRRTVRLHGVKKGNADTSSLAHEALTNTNSGLLSDNTAC